MDYVFRWEAAKQGFSVLPRWGGRLCCLGAFAASFFTGAARAGNDANFVLDNHHTEEAGVTDISASSDFSTAYKTEPRYSAQTIGIDHAFTDRLMAAICFEGASIQDVEYKFGSFRANARYRLFEKDVVFVNPVLYVEYAHLTTNHKYIRTAMGRADKPRGEQTVDSVQTKLIMGRDLTDRLDVAFNWINESNIETSRSTFGYAVGLNYKLYESESGGKEEKKSRKDGMRDAELPPRPNGWGVKEVKLGVEVFGGLGDAILGLTFDPRVTQHYAGLNLMTEFQNGFHMTIGAAAGLTGESDHGLLRLQVGYQFE